jgi:hypothetical protein
MSALGDGRIVAHVGLTDTTRPIVRALADGTGLSEEEIWLAAASTVVAAALFGLFRAFEVVTDLKAELVRMNS